MRRAILPRILGLIALCLWLVPTLVMAAPTRRVTTFQSQVVTEDRQSFLRIEIGMNGPIKDYEVKGDGILNPNRLTIDIDKAEKGDVRAEIPLDRKFAKTLHPGERRVVPARLVHDTRLGIAHDRLHAIRRKHPARSPF